MSRNGNDRGAFITVEGADGAGKTTQMDFIEGWLTDRGIDVVRTREPGGTPLGERLRDLLLHDKDLSISADTELMMVFAARRQHIEELILPAMEAGRWVLSDRFTDATYAYQGAGRGISEQRIALLEQWVQEGLFPDLTLVLDVALEVGVSRSEGRNDTRDRFEREAVEFKQAVRQCYLDRARRYSDRIRVIDAGEELLQVQRCIAQQLHGFVADRGIA